MRTKQLDILKAIAMLSMLIDHIGLLFFPEQDWFRQIGRLAFPLFAFFLAQGFIYTSSRKKYFSRLLLFGVIFQVPFVWLNQGSELDLWQVNQIPMLLYAGLVLVVLEQAKQTDKVWLKPVFISLSLLLAFVPEVLMYYFPDLSLPYGAYGILLSLMFYWFDQKWPGLVISFIALSWFYPYRYFVQWATPEGNFFRAWFNGKDIFRYYQLAAPTYLSFSGLWSQNNALFALPAISLAQQYSGRWKMNKWLAYWFYPGHIALLVTIYHLFMK